MAEFKVEDNVWQVHLESAADLLGFLSPEVGLFRGNQRFRGHGDANWKLMPVAFRKVQDGAIRGLSSDSPYMEIVEWEARVLREFISNLDEEGFEVPGGYREAWSEADSIIIADITKKQFDRWPGYQAVRALTLAQHYGAPTRLLDWTTRHDIAAYFAARDCLTNPERSEKLAVWVALRSVRLSNRFERLDFTYPQRYGNENLRAQCGLMLVYRQPNNPRDPLPFESLHELVPAKPTVSLGESELAFMKVTLPASQAALLLWLLRIRGVHGASLFPGIGGVAKLTQERELYPHNGDPELEANARQESTDRRQLVERLGLSNVLGTVLTELAVTKAVYGSRYD